MSASVKQPRQRGASSAARHDRAPGAGEAQGRGESGSPFDEPQVARFFAGVAQVRDHLDRHLQDPGRRAARLAQVAQDMIRPRRADELGVWLCRSLGEALGAKRCLLLQAAPAWHVWKGEGALSDLPPPAALEALARHPGAPLVVGEGLLVGFHGGDDLFGALYLVELAPLSASSLELLVAVVGTAGMLLAQSLKMEALGRPG